MSAITYEWTFGEVDVCDKDGLEAVALTIHNIRCKATHEDGTEYNDFLMAHPLPDPDPDTFVAIISMDDDPEAAQAQRRAWVGETRIGLWESKIAISMDEKRAREATAPRTIS